MRSIAPVLIAGFFALGLPAAAENLRLFSLGSAGVDGAYHAVARAVCEKVNRAEAGRLRCSPEPTSGSLYNLAALRDGQLDFAIVQSDWQKHALLGTSVFEARGPDQGLRSVMSLHAEPFTLLARGDAGNARLADLVGRRVDIGHASSGRQSTMRVVMEALGLSEASFSEMHELQSGAAIDSLCAGLIDATVLIVGHPNAAVGRAIDGCGAILVPVDAPEMGAMLAENTDYRPIHIPIRAYPALSRDVPTFAVTATLVTRLGVEHDLVESLVRHTIADLDRLRTQLPLLADLDHRAMRSDGLTAPLHPAAEAAFEAHLVAAE